MKPVEMKHATTLVTACIVLLCVLISGCTLPFGTAPAPTPAPTPVITTVPATVLPTVSTPAPARTDGPVETMPAAQQVNVELSKDRPTSEIHLLYQGGPGDVFTQKIVMRVYTSNTTYEDYTMSNGKKPIPGDEIVAPGTRGADRCEVFVTAGGIRYKVLDQLAVEGRY
jgi:hypothetical protein